MTNKSQPQKSPYWISYRLADKYHITVEAVSEEEAVAKAQAVYRIAPELFQHFPAEFPDFYIEDMPVEAYEDL